MPGGSYDPGEASHAALRELRRTVEKHPAVERAEGFPKGSFTHVEADVVPARLGQDAETATLTIRWFAGETPDGPPQFSVHYSERSGFDCGWHHEPNPYVEGWGYYQERPSSDVEYSYGAVSLEGRTPGRILWEILADLEERL